MAEMFEPMGTTITFDSGFLAQILDITGPDISRGDINISHFGTTDWHEFIPTALADGGELSCTIGFFPGTAPPILNAKEQVTITFTDSATTSWVFMGFMTGYSPTGTIGDKMTADVTIKASGEVAFDGSL